MTSTSRLYIEIDIQADIDLVWHLTQDPASHQRWDLRFSEIEYRPRPNSNEPQRFLYQTRIRWLCCNICRLTGAATSLP